MSTFRVLHIIAVGIIPTLCASCGPARMQLPTDRGTLTKADEASFVYFDASRQPCSLEPLTAEASIRGTIGKLPINGRFSFAAAALRLRLESVGKTPRDFVFTTEEAMEAFFYRGAYRMIGKSAEVIETILGLPLKAEDLRRVLTGCPRISGTVEGFRFDDRWFQVRVDGGDGYGLYAQRDSDGLGWTIRVIDGAIPGTTNRWRAEFQRDAKGLPKWVHVVSSEWNGVYGKQFDVRVSFHHVRVNSQLPSETFRIEFPSSIPTTALEGLRRSRPQSAPFLVDPRVK